MFPTLCGMTSFTSSWVRYREAFGGLVKTLVLVFVKLGRMCDNLIILLFGLLGTLQSQEQFMSSIESPGILAVE
jgi:hypothetical protein